MADVQDEISTLPAKRRCLFCDIVTDALRCPFDGHATMSRGPSAFHADMLVPGQLVAGRYRLGDQLGRGGFGRVFAAVDRDGREMALKAFSRLAEDTDGTAERRFLLEAHLTASLQHPNTVRVYDFGQDDLGTLFIAMERIHGHPVGRVLRQRPVDESEASAIGVCVLSSLEEAHAKGIVHRDIKPSNIMLAETDNAGEFTVKLLDFGVAKLRNLDLTGASMMPGTVSYASPENALGEPVDARSDLYSVGVLLYELVCGEVPFRGNHALETLYMHVNRPAPDPRAHADVSATFAAVVARALQKRPEDRFADAAAMRAALAPCMLPRRPTAPAVPPPACTTVQMKKPVELTAGGLDTVVANTRPTLTPPVETGRSLRQYALLLFLIAVPLATIVWVLLTQR